MSKIITIAGQKGGIGKSTAAVNIASSLALLEKKTLMIDCDPQACSTQWSGIQTIDYASDLSKVLSGRSKMTDAIVRTQIRDLDVLPGSIGLYHSALKLSRTKGNEKILRLFMRDVAENYDYIIIDTSSSYHFMTTAAMIAADTLLILVSSEDNTYEDFNHFLRMVKYIRSTHDVPVTLGGLVFNRCEKRQDGLDFLEAQGLSDISKMVYQTVIPKDQNIQEAAAKRAPVSMLNVKSPASQAFLGLAKEIDDGANKRGVA